MADQLANLESEQFCYLTTTGRSTGKKHTIEIWFALNGSTLYMLSGGKDKSDWVKNIRKISEVSVKIGQTTFHGQGREVAPESSEDALARRLIYGKYSPSNNDLEDWARTSLPVAIDFSF